MPADHIGDKSCRIRHGCHLNHGFRTILKGRKHARAHLAACRFLKYGVGVTVIVEFIVLALAHDLDIHPHCARKGVKLHHGTRLITRRASIDDAILIAKLFEIAADDNICLNIHHNNMLLVIHSVDCDLDTNLRYPRHVNCNLDKVCLRDKIGILRCNVFSLLHVSVRLFERLCHRDLLITDAGIVERIDDVVELNI